MLLNCMRSHASGGLRREEQHHAVRNLHRRRHRPRPGTGYTQSEAERIQQHRPGRAARRRGGPGRLRARRAPQPAVRPVVADHPAGPHRRADPADHAEHLGHADDHQRPGEDRRGLRDAPARREGPARPDGRPGQHRAGLPVVRQGHPPGRRAGAGELQPAAPAVARGRGRLGGQVPHPAAGLHLDPAAAGRRAAVRLARLDPHPGDRRAGRVLRQRLLRQPHPGAELPLQAAGRSLPAAVRALRPRHRRPGDRRPRRACRSSPSARRTR